MANRTETTNDYHTRINRVLVYINSNLGQQMDLNRLADISSFSPYHFHRIMRAHLNEPLWTYIVRLRLEMAAGLIKLTKEPINEIAFKVGYESAASFTKAFRKRFNTSPNEFRSNNGHNMSDANYLKLSNGGSIHIEINPKIRYLKPKKVLFAQGTGKYGGETTAEAWAKLSAFLREKKLFSWKSEALGIGLDDPDITEPEKCRYLACWTITTDIKPEGEIGIREIAGEKYAVFRYKGTYSNLGKVYGAIFLHWYPKSGFQLRNQPCFEKYLNNPANTKPEKLLTEIYVPVE